MLSLVTLGYLLILEIHLQWLKSIIVSLKKFFLIHKNDKALKRGGGNRGSGRAKLIIPPANPTAMQHAL